MPLDFGKAKTLKDMKEEMQNYLMKFIEEAEANKKEEEKWTGDKKIKTYIIESNNSEPEYAVWPESTQLIKTQDKNLRLVITKINDVEKINYLDFSDKRFWYLHSVEDSNNIKKIIKELIVRNRNKLDYCWYASNFIEKKVGFGEGEGFNIKFRNEFLTEEEDSENLKQFSMLFWGGRPHEVLDKLRQKDNLLATGMTLTQIKQTFRTEYGVVKESINYNGNFTLNKGDSIISYFDTLDKVKYEYFELLKKIEDEYRIKFDKNENGIKVNGMYSLIEFGKELENLDLFINRIFSAKSPFRLWGIPQRLRKDFVRVLAVDLHTFDRFTLEITPKYMRVFLSENSCGNVITRLVTNLQLYFDSQIKLIGYEDEQLI